MFGSRFALILSSLALSTILAGQAFAQAPAVPPPSDAEREAVLLALEDEYRAMATYDRVLADHGAETLPFAHIREAEARHAERLIAILASWGIEAPANTWAEQVEGYESVLAACEAGAAAEVDNVSLYADLLARELRPEVRAAFEQLSAASQERHLAAFQRCVSASGDYAGDGCGHGRARGNGPGRGHGRGHGGGQGQGLGQGQGAGPHDCGANCACANTTGVEGSL